MFAPGLVLEARWSARWTGETWSGTLAGRPVVVKRVDEAAGQHRRRQHAAGADRVEGPLERFEPGRAGRGAAPGRGLVQTWQPDHPVMRALLSGDAEKFYAVETDARQIGRAHV